MDMPLPFKHEEMVFRNKWAAVSGTAVFEDDNTSIVIDADLYNMEELLQLTGQDAKDIACLVWSLYLRYGLSFFEKLRGTFRVCIVEKNSRKLIVATDRFGIKPIVYYSGDDTFAFGSGIKDILSLPEIKATELDYAALVDYINLSAIPTPKTIYKNIKRLPPGCFVIVENEGRSILKRYYDIEYSEEMWDENYIIKHLPQVIGESVGTIVKHELSMGNSIGAFLSGGTDSSTVTGMIKKITATLKTFSIGFDEPGYNELHYARIAAKHFGAEHHEYVVTPEDVLRTVDIIIDAYDEPFGNASAVPTYFCALLAKENGVDTLFAGDGGDEIFGGNERYAANNIFRMYHRIPHVLRNEFIEPIISAAPSAVSFMDKAKKYVRRANIPQPQRFYSYNPVTALGKETIFSSDLLYSLNGYEPLQWACELYNSAKADEEIDRLLYLDMKFTITDNDLRKVSVMSEKAGITAAYPFLDHYIVDFAAKIPGSLKVKGNSLRYIFKKALKGFLPPEIIKKKKHGFGLPIGVWIRTKKDISVFVKEILLNPNISIGHFFRKGFIEELFRLHDTTGAAFYGDIIWNLLILELWNSRQRYGSHLSKIN